MHKSEILHLNLHREFFAAIAAKTKRVEYRERTPYWERRLESRKYKFIQFRNGYATVAPEMLVEFRGMKKVRKWGKPHYTIALGRILKIKRGTSSVLVPRNPRQSFRRRTYNNIRPVTRSDL